MQKAHATDILNVKREAKRNKPKMYVGYVHVPIL